MDELIQIVRYLINDIDGTTYTDLRLSKTIAIGARFVNEFFSNYYTISLSGSGTISPDPTVERNEAFINLTSLKAACLIGLNESKLAAGQGIMIRDGSSQLDLRGVSTSKTEIGKTFCDIYEDAKIQHLAGGTSAPPGEAILGPIKYYYNERRYF